jgi:hypothetical protein
LKYSNVKFSSFHGLKFNQQYHKHYSQLLSMASSKLGSLATVSISAISIIRAVVGGSMLLGPEHSAQLFGVPLAPETSIIGRLFGSRDLALGALLWYARATAISPSNILHFSNEAVSKDATGILKYALYTGVAVDLMDIGGCAVAFLDGTISERAVAFLGGGAVLLVTLAGFGLRSL